MHEEVLIISQLNHFVSNPVPLVCAEQHPPAEGQKSILHVSCVRHTSQGFSIIKTMNNEGHAGVSKSKEMRTEHKSFKLSKTECQD
jgi:hypothetical protein